MTEDPQPSKFARACGKALAIAVLAPILAASAWVVGYFLTLPF